MSGKIRRLTVKNERANTSSGNDASDFVGDGEHSSDIASGLSDSDIIDTAAIGSAPEDGGEIDPEAPYGRKADGTPRKRRGRQPGAGASERKTAGSKKKSALGLEGLASIMANMTLMLAAATSIPEASLSIEETTLISEAAENVAKYYDLSLDSKAVAWANLAMTAGGIIGAHVVSYKMRVSNERNRAA